MEVRQLIPTMKLIREKSRNLYLFSAVVKLTTSPFAPQILFYIFFAGWLYPIPGSKDFLITII